MLPSAPSHAHFSQSVKRQFPLIAAMLAIGLALATTALFVKPAKYEVQAYIDAPYVTTLTQLNLGRSPDSGLTPYTPEQVYVYFTRRLVSESALQRFFKETYLPAQVNQPTSVAEEQALFAQMRNHVLRVVPPPPKGRMLYSIQMTAQRGSDAAQWAEAFLAQVEQDAKEMLLSDAKQSISVQIRNQERDWHERLQTAKTNRKDRLAQLGEALQIAHSIGQHEPQITRAQPPRLDGLTSYMDGSQLFARGTKSLQAEMDVLKRRQDDAPFVDGLRAAEAKLNLLKELQTTEPNFSVYHVDGNIAPPEHSTSTQSTLILLAGLMFGGGLGTLIALWREGVLQRWLRDDNEENNFPALAPAKLPTANARPASVQTASHIAESTRRTETL